MRETSLCYIEDRGQYLMLHRVKKENDENKDKWIGVGGKLEAGESPEECMLREVREETGLVPALPRYRGAITFISDIWGSELMHLFTAKLPEGTDRDRLPECDEGELVWVDRDRVPELPIWEGDKIFLRLLAEDAEFFLLELVYRGDELVSSRLEKKDSVCF